MALQKTSHELTIASAFQFASQDVTRLLPTDDLSRTFLGGAGAPTSWVAHPLEGAGPGSRKMQHLEKVLDGTGLLQAEQEEREWVFVSGVLFHSCYSCVLDKDAQCSWHSLFTFKNPVVLLLIDIWKLKLRLIQSKLFSLMKGY